VSHPADRLWLVASALYGVLALAVLAIAAFIAIEVAGGSDAVGRVLALLAATVIAVFCVIPFRAAIAFARRSPHALRRGMATRVGCLGPLVLMLSLALVGFVRSVLADDAIYQILAVVAILAGLMGLLAAANATARRVGRRTGIR